MHATDDPTPTDAGIPQRLGDFATLAEALDYAATGRSGLNFHSGRGALVTRLPYAALREAAQDQAGRLLALGLRPGDRVALVAETSASFVTAFFACQYAGLLPVPLPTPAAFADRNGYRAQVARQLDRCGARLILGPAELAGSLSDTAGRSWDALPALSTSITLPPPDPDGLCYLQFSSGSTRFPKGIAVSQRSVLANLRGIVQALAIGPRDRGVTWLPLFHDMGLVGVLLTAVACQSSLDLLATEDFARRPGLWLDLIARNGGTVSYSPTFGYELCLRRADRYCRDLGHWRVAGIGGEMIRPQVLADFAAGFAAAGFRARAFVASYGLAEATLGVSFAPLGRGVHLDTVRRRALEQEGRALPAHGGDAEVRRFVRCGRPLAGHAVEVRDRQGRPLPPRRIGRIFFRGASVMRGYFADPEATAEVLHPHGWLEGTIAVTQAATRA